MIVHFVRHGQSIGNASTSFHDHTTDLSELGRAQARFVAKSLQKYPIETLISSPWPRTKTTATIISETLNLPVIENDLFHEVVRATETLKERTHPDVLHIHALQEENIHNPDWHYSDEENFHDAKLRALQAKVFLESRNEAEMCVVTHGMFLRFLFGVLAFGDTFSPEHYLRFRPFLHTENTGICTFLFNNNVWRLSTWNDHAHMSEIEGVTNA